MIRLVCFFVSDAKLQVLGSIKNNIQKLAVDDIFPIGVILIGRESMIDRILSTFHMPISYQ